MNRQITIDGNRTAYGTEGGKVLWNFGTSACNVAFQDCNQGPVLAPNGSITAIASHNGSVFAKTVTNTNCEIHQNPFRSQKSAASSTKAALAVGAAVESTGEAYTGTDALPFSVAMASDYYASEDHAAVDYYVEKAEELSVDEGAALVVSDNIGISGVLAGRCPGIPIEYLDVYTDTAQAYEAYAPTVSIVESLHDTLDAHAGRYIVLASTDVLGDAQSIYDFAEEYDSEVVEIREYAYPYSSEDGFYVVAVLER